MTTAQVVKASVTVNNNSPIQDYIYPDDQTQPTFDWIIVHFQVAQSLFLKTRVSAGEVFENGGWPNMT